MLGINSQFCYAEMKAILFSREGNGEALYVNLGKGISILLGWSNSFQEAISPSITCPFRIEAHASFTI